MGLARGMVRKRMPSDMTICFLPWRITLNPAFSKARIAANGVSRVSWAYLDGNLDLPNVGAGEGLP